MSKKEKLKKLVKKDMTESIKISKNLRKMGSSFGGDFEKKASDTADSVDRNTNKAFDMLMEDKLSKKNRKTPSVENAAKKK